MRQECPITSCDPADLLVPAPTQITYKGGNAPQEGPVSSGIDPALNELGDEGYYLSCHQEGYRLTARTKRGLFYGQQTIRQIKSDPLIPLCEIMDVPRMPMRAVMFDLARCKEKHEYYYHMIDQLAHWKINTVFLHLTDHNGCAIEIKRYPFLATRYAFTQDEMRKLVKYAQDRHVELIPEIESWGHAGYLIKRPELAELAEDPDDPRALCTSNPKTWEVLGHIFDEMAGLFPSQYLHAGCDEAAFGKCPRCTAKAERESKDSLVGEHLRKVCELVQARGKTPMVWGDVLLNHRGSADLVPQGTVITDWHYDAKVSPESVEFLKGKGFEVVGCPAVVWGSRMILPRTDTLDNVESFAQIVLDQQCLGMETTVWCPARYITDTLCFALAHAAELSWSGPKRSRLDFAKAFARSYFGLDPREEIAQTLVDVHELSDKSFAYVTDLWEYTNELGKQDDAKLLDEDLARRERAREIATALKAYRSEVSDHVEEYDALVLGAKVGAYVRHRSADLRKLVHSLRSARTGQDRARAVRDCIALVERLLHAEEPLRARLESAWDRWRYADDPLKVGGGENILAAFYDSEQFLTAVLQRLREMESVAGEKTVDWEKTLRRQ